jgi:MATE family multidrug resistance protein
LGKRLSIAGLRKVRSAADEEAIDNDDEPSESSALLGADPTKPYGGEDTPKNINKKWEEACAAGKIQTTWQRESKTLVKYSAPLIITFLLQYSLTVASIFTVGHIGKVELGAVSLASSTYFSSIQIPNCV